MDGYADANCLTKCRQSRHSPQLRGQRHQRFQLGECNAVDRTEHVMSCFSLAINRHEN